jgi:DNA modification methylase
MRNDPLTILQGDALAILKTLPDDSVHCCVTSPPYWGLRDYGVEGQIGLEKTPAEYLERMVAVFEEVRRVLKKDGTCWVNMGDGYAGGGNGGGGSFAKDYSDYGDKNVPFRKGSRGVSKSKRIECGSDRWGGGGNLRVPQLKAKDLVGMPWRLAFVLQDSGWYLRQDIIWSKPNPMPESITDRCTKSHEYIFLLTKSPRYFYDQEAISEPVSLGTHARLSQNIQAQIGSARANGGAKTNGNMKAVGRNSWPGSEFQDGKNAVSHPNVGKNRKHGEHGAVKNNASFDASLAIIPAKRNKRSVWTVATHSYKEAHFATFPPDLIKPCILAGCPVGGLVIDPFGGSGTTGQVALKLGRRAILIELNPAYITLIRKRCAVTPGLALTSEGA